MNYSKFLFKLKLALFCYFVTLVLLGIYLVTHNLYLLNPVLLLTMISVLLLKNKNMPNFKYQTRH